MAIKVWLVAFLLCAFCAFCGYSYLAGVSWCAAAYQRPPFIT